jgi:hypothetical protein
MHSRFGRLAAAVAVIGMGALMVASRSALASAPNHDGTLVMAPVVVTAPAAVASAAEPHPEIAAAIHSLENAKAHLLAAAHDYHGHRRDAIAAIDGALHQLHICMDFD